MKIIIALAFAFILMALASAGWFMLKRPGAEAPTDASGVRPQDKRMARALAVRVGVSVAVFVVVLLSYSMGWIQPTGLPLSR